MSARRTRATPVAATTTGASCYQGGNVTRDDAAGLTLGIILGVGLWTWLYRKALG